MLKKIYRKIIISFYIFVLIYPSLKGQTPCVGGMAGIYPCDNVDLLAFIPLSSLGGTFANDVWGWTDPDNGKEYALLGLNTGTAFVDISDPLNPVYLGNLPTATNNSSWRDIKVYNDHAFIVSEASGHGIQSFDLRTLRNVTNPPVTFSALATYNNIGAGDAHNIVGFTEIDHMVVVGGAGTGGASGGLILIDVSNPANMIRTGEYALDGYTHDAQAVIYLGPDSLHIGKEIVVASNEDTQTIIDVTDKTNPTEISKTPYNGSSYTHQGWLTQDHKYLIFNDELDEYNNGVNTTTFIFDVTDLDSPVLAGKFVNSTTSIDHNLYIRGNYVYQSNYTSGLRIQEMTDLSTGSLTEVGYFDVYPTNDDPIFKGSWSNYPYFPSGNIVASSMNEGLFILRPSSLPHFEIKGPNAPVYIHRGNVADIDLDLVSHYGFSDNVTLTFSGHPATMSVNFNGSVLEVRNTSGVTEGNYSILIEGNSSGIKHSFSVGIIVTSPCATNVINSSGTGPNTLDEAIACAHPNETIYLSSLLANTTINLGASSFTLNKNLTIEADPSDNIALTSSDVSPTIKVEAGTIIELKGFNITNTSGMTETILNNGRLTLDNMTIQNDGVNNHIYNSPNSQITFRGVTRLKN